MGVSGRNPPHPRGPGELSVLPDPHQPDPGDIPGRTVGRAGGRPQRAAGRGGGEGAGAMPFFDGNQENRGNAQRRPGRVGQRLRAGAAGRGPGTAGRAAGAGDGGLSEPGGGGPADLAGRHQLDGRPAGAHRPAAGRQQRGAELRGGVAGYVAGDLLVRAAGAAGGPENLQGPANLADRPSVRDGL